MQFRLPLFAFLAFFAGASAHGDDRTRAVEKVGNPFITKYPNGEHIYSRNIWDMQVFNGRIYFGGGNSSNLGPSSNSGPVPIAAFDPRRKRFFVEETVADEQIDVIRLFGNDLIIPGHDATQGWDWGNFYKRTRSGKWNMHRNIPKAVHVYDLLATEERWFAAIGVPDGLAAVAVSSDSGASWVNQLLGEGRVYNFLQVGSDVYAVKLCKKASTSYSCISLLQDDGRFRPLYDLGAAELFPDTTGSLARTRVVRSLPLNSQTLYIGAKKHNDHQSKPFGVFSATSRDGILRVNRIDLPPGHVPRDILVHKDSVFLLTSEESDGATVNRVLRSTKSDTSEWRELVSFRHQTFARSFEFLSNAFYFGMGCEVSDPEDWQLDELKLETGDILRLRIRL